MNKRQLEVQKILADNEEKVIRLLKQVYAQARKDCEAKIRELSTRTDMENLQSIVYQKQYQEALKKQIDGILDTLNAHSFTTIADYLAASYEDGFFGTLYDLQGQGIPLIFPINQEEVVKALQIDSKLSKGLYNRLGEDVTYLKKSIRAELSRGAAKGESWNQIAVHIAKGMNSPFNKAYNRAITIARTEGHRVQQESAFHCQQRAKSKGADVVKQWDSTLDGLTRPHHRELDGQVRELEESFEVAGKKGMYPGAFGDPSEDCNCRCCLLQRAKWALSEEKYYTKWNGDKKELVRIKAKTYNDFKGKAKEEIRKQELANGWSGSNYSQNYTTKKQAIQALQDKYGIKFSDSRKYPINDSLLCDAVSWMDAFTHEYSVFTEKNPVKLPAISCKAANSMKGKLGYFTYYTNSRVAIEIALNGAYHSDLNMYEDYIKSSVASKWSVANATTHKTIIHEYGHYVSNAMTKILGDNRWERNFIQECVDEFKKTNPDYQKRTYVGLEDFLSRYGTTSESECFAEAFAEFYGGKNPREFATIFGTKLDKLLKEVK
ncbi:phage minor head protein [Parablautia intestinalis]|uniref:phage minor head protein n=1 Tax=Parablautia intestinalis TaxID=2320100 RepID=UPI00256EB446|nr:phage minor head protein [Parablautia intestinalis]